MNHILPLVLFLTSFLHAAAPVPARSEVEGSPRSIPYYDIRWAKGLTLEDMKVKEVDRTVEDGVEIIAVTYSAFEQPYATAEGGVKVLPWDQRALLFLPPGGDAASRVRQAVLYNSHGLDFKKRESRQYGVAICKAFAIPVMLHGWEANVVKPLAGKNYHNTQAVLFNRLLDAKIENAADMPMDGRYLVNGLPLAKGDMVSITLLQRLAAKERGMEIKEVGTLGISKEGWSHWILGAVDDRVAVLAPGGHYVESYRDALERYRADWNGEYPRHLGNVELFRAVLRIGDWLLTTEAGRTVDRAMSPEHWSHLFHARHLLISGDLGQHDGPFPVLAENRFIAKLSHPSWRYVRAFDGNGISDLKGDMSRSLLPHVADLLLSGSTTPTTPTITVEEEGRRIRVKAQCRVHGGLKTEAMLLYMISADRMLRPQKMAWKTETMAAGKRPEEFESPLLPQVPPNHAITFMAVVREMVERPPIRYWRSSSSLPQERFPLPEHAGKMPSWKEK